MVLNSDSASGSPKALLENIPLPIPDQGPIHSKHLVVPKDCFQ